MYSKNRVILFGAVGVLVALSIIVFLPARSETHVATGVSLELIQGYGFQTVKISEDNVAIESLVIKVDGIEAEMPSGEWLRISDGGSWDIRSELEKTYEVETNVLGYSRIRLFFDSDGSSVTLADGSVVQLGVSSIPLEIDLQEPYLGASTVLGLRLSLGQGTGSNFVLPELMIELGTSKLSAEIVE